jgi:hypothetical protein
MNREGEPQGEKAPRPRNRAALRYFLGKATRVSPAALAFPIVGLRQSDPHKTDIPRKKPRQ